MLLIFSQCLYLIVLFVGIGLFPTTIIAFPTFFRTRFVRINYFPRATTSSSNSNNYNDLSIMSNTFTPVTLPEPPRVDPEDVAEQFRGGATNLVIVDVRDGDFAGGHIKGCINIPSAVFNDGFDAIDQLIDRYKSAPTTSFVFHCMKSQQRGPSAAKRFVGRLNDRGLPAGMGVPEVSILRGGYEAWELRYSTDGDMVEK